ncbi:hypothetical protein BB558_003194 [Smittium angustum]|uniref:Glycylpeptide N-tetradecanoyltransferase n=1 Tax=Smittium angustum TaxID=133377 RepID=A0A2U1J6L5_SMIAN|nr:hypothetical protein BB558_003194 [Smittium angustum]
MPDSFAPKKTEQPIPDDNPVDSQPEKIEARIESTLKQNIEATREQKESIRKLLDSLNIKSLEEDLFDESETKKIENKNHEFWKTQPVPKADDVIKKDGPVHPDIPFDKIPKEKVPLPEGYIWCNLDIYNKNQMKELYTLLSLNYVEDSDEMFRFNYLPEFLIWALDPPGQNHDWHIGVRKTDGSDELVGFIAGLEIDVKVNETVKRMAEINFLCINKSLRKQRLAPILIKEVTRRFHLNGIFQAVYTAGIRIPTPFAVCQYFHRPLNPKKLVDSGFSRLPLGMTMSRLVANYKLVQDQIPKVGIVREMRKHDVPQVRKLLSKYLNARSKMHQVFKTDEMVSHWLLPQKDVVYTYVVEDMKKAGKITDFFSFYLLPSSILKNSSATNEKKHVGPAGKKKTIVPAITDPLRTNPNSLINSAYLFYYGSNPEPAASLLTPENKSNFKEMNEAKIKERTISIIGNALMMAKKENFDVFNCVKLLDNELFLDELKFGGGDGYLHYYFYNWLTKEMENKDVGLTML